MVVVLLLAGGLWAQSRSTVPVGERDDLAAALADTSRELAETEDELAVVEEDLEEVQEALVEAFPPPPGQLPEGFEQAQWAAMLLGFFAGADPDILEGSAWHQSWAGVVMRDIAVERIGDERLTELYWDHLADGVGGPLEALNDDELALRLVELAIEPILRSGR